ncbi:MAG: hypothetical protein M3O46_00195, partial [Myxococcota bacterium]|nr:hypothetical protein [Myxococcota bacterium]
MAIVPLGLTRAKPSVLLAFWLAGTTACRSPEAVRVTLPSPPYESPMHVATPRPTPTDACGAPPAPAATLSAEASERTTVEMPPPAVCRGVPNSGTGSGARIRGVATVVTVPWGVVSLGGPELCVLRKGGRGWERFYEVPGDNLYRVAGDASGRLLAYWEKDPDIHLFVPAKKQHVRFRR